MALPQTCEALAACKAQTSQGTCQVPNIASGKEGQQTRGAAATVTLRVPLKEILARELLSSPALYFIQLQLLHQPTRLHRPLPCRPAAQAPSRPALRAQDSSSSHSLHAALKGCLGELLPQHHVCRGPPAGQSRPCSAPRAGALEGSTQRPLCDPHHHVHYRSQAPSSKPIEGKGFELQPPRPAQRNTVHCSAWRNAACTYKPVSEDAVQTKTQTNLAAIVPSMRPLLIAQPGTTLVSHTL